MAVTLRSNNGKVRRIIANHPDKVDLAQVQAKLIELTEAGRVTDRDEQLLEHLRELNVLSLNQVYRLLWPKANSERVTYNRLYFLQTHYLLSGARAPAMEMKKWQLPVRKVYTMGAGGWLWLLGKVDDSPFNPLKREQVVHDLLVSEFYVRLVEAARARGERWTVTWSGERGAAMYNENHTLMPDGLTILQEAREDNKTAVLPFFVEVDKSREAHGRPSSDWGRKIHGYDHFYNNWKTQPQLSDSPTYPWVVVITHGAQRMVNLAQAILKHRKEPVIYYMGLWEDVVKGHDIMTTPMWLVITQDGHLVGREPEQRQALVPFLDPLPPPSPAKKKDVSVSGNGAGRSNGDDEKNEVETEVAEETVLVAV